VGTGNKSEDYIGYDTKGGDALADVFPIGELFKSEVFQLLDYYRDRGVITEDMIDREPSAGLWEGQKDTDELEYTYDEMEPAILRAEHGELDHSLAVDEYVWNRHLENKHKHEAAPTFPVTFRDEDVVIRMMRCRP
jgi:NAD+ synthase